MKKIQFLFLISFLFLSFSKSYSQIDSLSTNVINREERIKQFHSDIRIKENGNLIITENITVYAAEKSIDHGIYRELPMESNSSKVSKNNFYTVLSVFRGNLEEPYHVKTGKEKFKIYIGDKDMNLPEGTYTYKLTYEVEAQIHSYKDFDEVYWNVTGNYWQFEIENVTARVILPKSAKAIQTYCYTGILGSKAHECNAQITGNTVFFTSKNLKIEEGFTIAAAFPKGIVNQPFFRPHYKIEEFSSPEKVLLAIFVVSLCFAFYYFSWKKYGEDPLLVNKSKTIDLKSRYSPAALQYLKDRSVNSQTLLTAIINLSIKGAVEILDNGKKDWEDEFKYSLKKGSQTANLSLEENAVLEGLFAENDSFEIDKKTYLIFDKAKEALEKSLKSKFNLKDYFLSNSKQMLIGFIITTAALLGYCYYDKGTIYWAAIFGFIFLVTSILLIKLIIEFIIKKDFAAIFACLFFLLFTVAFTFGLFIAVNVDKSYSILNLIVLFLIISGFITYLCLIGVYTELGLETKFQIEKFKQQLLDQKPEENASTITIYEENLPYAFALGIEEKYNQKYIDILKRLNYTNNWVKTSEGSTSFAPAIMMHFHTTYKTYSSAPSSSASSGGGSSGGGGGGGGGGGW